MRWRNDLLASRGFPQFCHPPYTHSTFFNVVAHTLVMDNTCYYGRYVSADWPMAEVQQKALKDRSLFWTESGFLGLGPRHLQPGDEVVIFDGDYAPFVLREQLRADDSKSNVFKIVGDCYLHGWMYDHFPDETVGGIPNRWTGADSDPEQAFRWISGRQETQNSTPSHGSRTFTIC